MKTNQKGSGTVELILLLVVVALIGLVGWYVYQAGQEDVTTESSTVSQTDEVPEINNASDLQVSEDLLNSSDIDADLSTTDIDAALNE